MTRILLAAMLLSACSTRDIRVKAPIGVAASLAALVYPEVFPPNTKFVRCWTAQDPRFVECDYVVENGGVEFRHVTVRR